MLCAASVLVPLAAAPLPLAAADSPDVAAAPDPLALAFPPDLLPDAETGAAVFDGFGDCEPAEADPVSLGEALEDDAA